LTFLVGETWAFDDEPDENCPVSTGVDITFAPEFR